MNPFEYQAATDQGGAVATVTGRRGAAFLGGGTNLVDLMKLGVAEPDLLVDIGSLGMDQIEQASDGGLRIGANVRNSDLAAHPAVRERYPVLAQALLAGASGQLRNAATTGGNLLQRTRCVYFQDVTTPCNKREPGSGCSAIGGYTRYHAILGASPSCVAVHPSDMAVAMTALDARVVVLGADGERTIGVRELHRLPGDRPEQDTTLRHGELITAVELPPATSVQRSAYRKVRDRASYAFALVSVAAILELDGERVSDVRICLGGVAHAPWRASRTEEALRGAVLDEQTLKEAVDAELAQARALPGNEFKIPLARNTIISVLRGLAAGDDGGSA